MIISKEQKYQIPCERIVKSSHSDSFYSKEGSTAWAERLDHQEHTMMPLWEGLMGILGIDPPVMSYFLSLHFWIFLIRYISW